MLEIAKHIIILKTQNQLNLLKLERNKTEPLKNDIKKTKEIINKIQSVNNYETLL